MFQTYPEKNEKLWKFCQLWQIFKKWLASPDLDSFLSLLTTAVSWRIMVGGAARAAVGGSGAAYPAGYWLYVGS